jgi:hypothetical protein
MMLGLIDISTLTSRGYIYYLFWRRDDAEHDYDTSRRHYFTISANASRSIYYRSLLHLQLFMPVQQ